MIERLHLSQTGFVPHCGIFINITRAIDRIHFYTDKRIHVYGIFIDFANAYNTIYHQPLFQRLEGILTTEDISYLRSIYSLLSIHAGNHYMKPNIGVAQDSAIFPALFNIYLDPLLITLTETLRIDTCDVFAYADNLMILMTSRSKIREVIEAIEKYSAESGLQLNKKKSGIVEFTTRHSKRFLTQEDIRGIPILSEYKYLGLYLTFKLSLNKQVSHIRRKCAFIKVKLNPILNKVSLEYRKNLWTTFPLYYSETPRKIKKCWKNWCGPPSNLLPN